MIRGASTWRCLRVRQLTRILSYNHHHHEFSTFNFGNKFNSVSLSSRSRGRTYPWNRFSPITSFLSDSASSRSILFSTSTSAKDKKDFLNKPVTKSNAPEQQIADMKILRTLASYLWMKDNFEFRLRVITALGFLVAAKVLNVQVPFLFKLAVDWLTTATTNATALAANSTFLALFGTPAAVLIGYGIARTTASAFNGTIPHTYHVIC